MTRSRKEGRWADIPSSRVRFVFEAVFLILVAFGAALMELSALPIVLLMAAALLLVGLIERASSRETVRVVETGEEKEEELPFPEPEAAAEPREAHRTPAAAADGAAPAGPVVAKRPLDPPGLAQPPAQPARPRGALVRAARRVAPPAPAPPPTPSEPPPAREWNLWDLERRARELAGNSPRGEEWSALFTHLRVFANPDGVLPKEFDGLVRESFGELIEAA